MSKAVDKLPYRQGVGLVLFNPAGLVFVGRRIDSGEAWQFPQGGIDDGETPRQAALRELGEEIGTDKADIIAETPDWLSYDLPANLVGKVWGGKYRGQRQKWFALKFLGQDDDIDLDGPHPEFDAWRWVRLADTPDLIVPFKRGIYHDVVAAFRHLGQA